MCLYLLHSVQGGRRVLVAAKVGYGPCDIAQVVNLKGREQHYLLVHTVMLGHSLLC